MTRKYQVVHIITSSDIGGAQQHVQDIVTNLNTEMFKPIVICGLGGEFDVKLRSLGIETYKIESLDKKINFLLDFKTLFKLIGILRKIQPVIVHTHSSKAGLLGRIAAKLCGISVIVFTAHGFVFHEFMSKAKYQFYLHLEKFAGLITDQIIAVSELDKAKAISNNVISDMKIQTVHNGIDIDLFKPDPEFDAKALRSHLKVSKDDIVIGLVGRLVEEKGIPYFIEAARILCQTYPRTKFVLVGDGPLRNSLEEKVNNEKLSNNFIFTGVREDVKVILSVFDIVVFSSIKEGLPLALLEALAMEKAVVATTAGGIPEVITSGKDGLLTPIGDSGLLAKAILSLINDVNLRVALGKAGRATVSKNFSLYQMVQATEKIYMKLLQEKKVL